MEKFIHCLRCGKNLTEKEQMEGPSCAECVLDMKENAVGTWSVPFSIISLDGKVFNDRVDIDFGGIYALKIALGNKHNIQLPENVEETQSFGAQGRNPEFRGKIKSMTFGQFTLYHMASASYQQGGWPTVLAPAYYLL